MTLKNMAILSSAILAAGCATRPVEPISTVYPLPKNAPRLKTSDSPLRDNANGSADEAVKKLQNLQHLRKKGLITEEEFNKIKADILKSIQEAPNGK